MERWREAIEDARTVKRNEHRKDVSYNPRKSKSEVLQSRGWRIW